MTKQRFVSLLQYMALVMVLVLPLAANSQTESKPKTEGFDLSSLDTIQSDQTVPAAQRVTWGVTYLKDELANPSPKRRAMDGGVIDTGKIQGAITGAVAIAAGDAPDVLRQHRDGTGNGLLRDRLTVALGMTGARDTIPDLVRIARTDKEVSIRAEAITALSRLVRDPVPTDVPKQLRPGEVVQPLDDKARQAAEETLIVALQDPLKRYKGNTEEERFAFFPVQEHAATRIRRLGYQVKATKEGWLVIDDKKGMAREVKVNRGRAPLPDESPRGLH